jgi:hypothetical protein
MIQANVLIAKNNSGIFFSNVTQIVPVPRYYFGTFTSTVIATAFFEKKLPQYRHRVTFSKYRFQHWLYVVVYSRG